MATLSQNQTLLMNYEEEKIQIGNHKIVFHQKIHDGKEKRRDKNELEKWSITTNTLVDTIFVSHFPILSSESTFRPFLATIR
jgi:hypothetical protein